MRALHRLSPLQIKNLGPGLYADGGNLFLQVSKSGRSWIFRYQIAGRMRSLGLGSCRDVDLRTARQKAADQRKLLADGIDPLEAKRARKAAAAKARAVSKTFDNVAAEYVRLQRAGWRNAKHAQQWENTLTQYASPIIGRVLVRDVDTGLVMRVLQPLWSTRPVTAGRLRGRIESILDAAKAQGLRDGENPARWKGHLANLLPKPSKLGTVKHHAALPYSDVPKFMAELRKQEAMGYYPPWWPGRKFDRPVTIWACGEDAKAMRDSIQPVLCGPPEAFGTGLLFGDSILSRTARAGVPDSIDTMTIRHEKGTSRLVFKTYDQGRESYQGASVDVCWSDEEPPIQIYTEGLTRTMSTIPGEPSGIVLCTFTPLKGISDVVRSYLPGGRAPGYN
jgi:phage terminase large subunit-like protein